MKPNTKKDNEKTTFHPDRQQAIQYQHGKDGAVIVVHQVRHTLGHTMVKALAEQGIDFETNFLDNGKPCRNLEKAIANFAQTYAAECRRGPISMSVAIDKMITNPLHKKVSKPTKSLYIGRNVKVNSKKRKQNPKPGPAKKATPQKGRHTVLSATIGGSDRTRKDGHNRPQRP